MVLVQGQSSTVKLSGWVGREDNGGKEKKYHHDENERHGTTLKCRVLTVCARNPGDLYLCYFFPPPSIESDNSEGQSPPALKLCFGCKQPIQDLNWLHVSPDINWHAHCLVCCECQLVLDEKHTCFLREGRAYCRKDFVR